MSIAVIMTDNDRGICIQRARKWLGWSQGRLADEANQFYRTNGRVRMLSRNIISSLESGNQPGTLAQIDAISRATGQKLQFFNGGEFTFEPIPGEPKGFRPSQCGTELPEGDDPLAYLEW